MGLPTRCLSQNKQALLHSIERGGTGRSERNLKLNRTSSANPHLGTEGERQMLPIANQTPSKNHSSPIREAGLDQGSARKKRQSTIRKEEENNLQGEEIQKQKNASVLTVSAAGIRYNLQP